MFTTKNFLVLLFVTVLAVNTLQAQNIERSIFDIQPFTVKSGNVYLEETVDLPTVLKTYNPLKNTFVDKPEVMVYNEFNLISFWEYGLTDDVNLFTKIPIRSIHQYIPDNSTSGKGFGDISLGAIWNFYQDRESNSSFTGKLWTDLPVAANTPAVNAEYPLGIDAFQVTAAVDGSIPWGNYQLIFSTYYNFVRNDGQSVNFGDILGTSIVLGKIANTQFGSFELETGVNFAYKLEDSKSGNSIKNTNDYYAQLLMGISYIYSNSLNFRLGVPYTVYRKDAWFTGYSVIMGIDYNFNINN